MQQWLAAENDDPVSNIHTDEDIIASVRATTGSAESDHDEDDPIDLVEEVTTWAVANSAFNTLLKFVG